MSSSASISEKHLSGPLPLILKGPCRGEGLGSWLLRVGLLTMEGLRPVTEGTGDGAGGGRAERLLGHGSPEQSGVSCRERVCPQASLRVPPRFATHCGVCGRVSGRR